MANGIVAFFLQRISVERRNSIGIFAEIRQIMVGSEANSEGCCAHYPDNVGHVSMEKKLFLQKRRLFFRKKTSHENNGKRNVSRKGNVGTYDFFFLSFPRAKMKYHMLLLVVADHMPLAK